MERQQNYVANVKHEPIDDVWHRYTIQLSYSFGYGWEDIIAGADRMADDLSPIQTVQLLTEWGAEKELLHAYQKSGFVFAEMEELSEEGMMLCIAGISKTLDRPTMITWFNQINGFGITTMGECSDRDIRSYAEVIAGKRFTDAAAEDKANTSRAEGSRAAGVRGIRQVTGCRTEAGDNGMFPRGDSQDEAMEMLDLIMGIRKYPRIYKYEIQLDSPPLTWDDVLRAADNLHLLDVALLEHMTYGNGKPEEREEKDITDAFFKNTDIALRRIPGLDTEHDFLAVRGGSLRLNVDVKVYFHNGKNLVTVYAPVADDARIREYAETTLCQVFQAELRHRSDENSKTEKPKSDPAETEPRKEQEPKPAPAKTEPDQTTDAPDDFRIQDGVLKGYRGKGGHVVIPNGVTSIGDFAFHYCSSLTSVAIPDGVTSIREYTFKNCENLTSITIPDGVTAIGDKAFKECKSLTSITIPDSVTFIGKNAFEDCESLKSIVFPSGGKFISNSTFEGCSSLTSVTIPDGVTSICKSAFKDCGSLTDIAVSSSVKTIAEGAFEGCGSLRSIIIPDGATSIGKSAFKGCKGLTKITVPNSVKSIGSGAFEGCSGLISVTISDGMASIGKSVFKDCKSLTAIVIPDHVKSIGESAFGGCSSLTSVTIPDSVTAVDGSAFAGCEKLTSVTLPKRFEPTLKTLFADCKSIKDIRYSDGENVRLAVNLPESKQTAADEPKKNFWQRLFKK